MGRGINLGNVLSAPFEGDWAPAVEESYFEDIANVGFQSVRVPIRFDNQTTTLASVNYTDGNGNYIGSPSDYTVNSTYLDRIEDVMGWALDKNLVAIIDVHGDHWFWESFDSSSTEYKTGNDRLAAIDRFKAIWTAIATRFQNSSEDLLFEIMNEAYFSMSASEVDDINTIMLSIIRQTNPTRNVIVTGGGLNSWEAPSQMSSTFINSDNYLIATFHYYKPGAFTRSGEEDQTDNDWGTQTDKDSVDAHFNAVQSWAQSNGMAVLLGEFGADNVCGYDYENEICGDFGGPDTASRVAYHKYIAEAAISRGFCFTVWDAGHKSNKTIYNVSDRSWVVDIRNALLDVNCISSQIIFNADIECGYNSEWSLFTQSTAVATYSNAEPANSRASSTTMKVDVTSQGTDFNSVVLSNQVLDASNYIGETLRISCFAKASSATQDFKIRVKADVNGTDDFTSSPALNISNSQFEAFEFFYDVPLNASTLQVQVMVGNEVGSYYFDDFFVDGTSTVNNISTSWYVSMAGDDNNNGISPTTPFRTFNEVKNNVQPGDTIFVMGTYTNDSYNSSYTYSGNTNDSHIWHAENTIRINNFHGTVTKYITIKPYDANTVLKGDGANIFRVSNSSYLNIEDFNIEGEVDEIDIVNANALQFVYLIDDNNLTGTAIYPDASDIKFRNEDETNDTDNIVEETDIYTDISNLPVKRPSYIDTRGLYVSNSENLIIKGNTIHHMPGGGLRVSSSKFVDILENEIYRCSAKSFSGTHALVVTKTEPIGSSGYSINILRNKVHHNYNEQYSWAPDKTIITPRIDEGKGISLQRNNTADWINGSGRILVANNLCYWNGFSGAHSNDGYRIDFINNTCYMNSYTNTVTYAGQEQNGKNIGVSAQSSDDIKMINNISVIDTDWNGYALAAGNTTNLEVSDNIIFGYNGTVNQDIDVVAVQINTTEVDPLFVNPGGFDFNLQSGSTAIGAANMTFAPSDDFFGTLRGAIADIGAIEYIVVTISTYTFNGNWSPSNPSGVSTSNDIINVISGNASSSINNISADTQANTLSISSGAKLVIDTTGALTVDNFNNQGELTIRSNSTKFGSFIPLNVTNSGNIIYRRFVNDNATEGGNDLIAAPVQGETFGVFADFQDNEAVIFNNPSNPSQRLFGPFDKSTNTYLNYDSDTADANIILQPGIGYRCGTISTSNNTVVFKGELETGIVNVPIVVSGMSFSEWNLIGNPYTANVDFETFFNTNKTQLNAGAFQAIYGYNATSNKWTIWNQLTIDDTNETEVIVPGQGFLVASKPENGIISFTPNMRKTGISDDFILNRSIANTIIKRANIVLNSNAETYSTDIYFLDGQTRGLDAGYDAGDYNGNADGLFTHLVENNTSVELAIQTLPISNVNNVTVSLGVKTNQGVQFSISLEDTMSTLGEDTYVYLEDTETNSWTLLNDGDYTITPNTDINGVGRFLLHFQTQALSITETEVNAIEIYVTNSNLHINGILNSPTTIEIFDLLGRQSISKELSVNTNQNTVPLNNLAKGVYIVHLKNESANKVQKILLN